MAPLLPGLRRAAPRISRDFFVCHQCLKQSRPTTRKLALPSITTPSSSLKNLRFNSTTATLPESISTSNKASPLGNLAQNVSKGSAQKAENNVKASFFPETTSNTVAYWLMGSAVSVFGIVIFGGLTRLTESGLSITEWKPVTGSLPPLSLADWQSEFDKYRASPEYKLLNPHMNLEEFKQIYYMEWGHRLWGRVVGLTFVLPAIYFVSRRRVSRNMSLRLFGISALIGFQGCLGWYMVKSGLKDDLFAAGSHPRVSQYRLTAHLGAAFLCYSAMLWNGLSILRDNKFLSNPTRALTHLQALSNPILSPFRKSTFALLLLVFTTALSGGLVAGLDAGLIYNEFPRMGTGFAPPKSELFSTFYSRKEDGSDIWWRNMLENPATVQLDHRILAMTTFTAIISLFAYTRFSPRVSAIIPASARKGMMGVVHLVLMQAALGISTLIYLVPTPLAAMHQAGALALLTGTLVLGNRIWVNPKMGRMLKRQVEILAKGDKGGLKPALGRKSVLQTN